MRILHIIIYFIFCLSICSCAITPPIKETSKPSQTTQVPKQEVKVSKKFALLLPLAGQHQNIAGPMLDAAQLALFDYRDKQAEMLIFDSEEVHMTENVATIKQQDVKIIIGPVFAKNTQILATKMGNYSIPIISFSNNKQLAAQGVLLFGFAPEQNITSMTDLALKSAINEFYILAPNSEYGNGAIAKIRELAMHSEVPVLKTEQYTNEIELIHAAKTMGAYLQNRPATEKRALFIIEAGERLTKVIRSLEDYHLEGAKLKIIIPNNLEDETLLTLPLLNHAWCIGSDSAQRKTFEQSFIKQYGYKPNHMAMLAYDATLLGLNYLNDPKGKDALFDQAGFAGSGGVFRFNAQGFVEREVSIMKIGNGVLRTL